MSTGGLRLGFPWVRYYDLTHGNPISHTHIERDFGGWFGGVLPLHLGGAERARKGIYIVLILRNTGRNRR